MFLLIGILFTFAGIIYVQKNKTFVPVKSVCTSFQTEEVTKGNFKFVKHICDYTYLVNGKRYNFTEKGFTKKSVNKLGEISTLYINPYNISECMTISDERNAIIFIILGLLIMFLSGPKF